MTNTVLEMTEDEFDAQYPLLRNHLNPHVSWVFGDGPGCLFETYGPELDFVRQHDSSTVWTLVDGDDGDQYLLSGFHFVNRIGYLVSTVAVPEGLDINVRLPMQSPCDGEAVEQPANSAHEATPFVTAPKRSTNALSTAGATAAVTRLLVPMGEALVPGQMYLRLYHGRTDPDEQMDDWGFVGPTFGPLACYVHTYCCTFRMHSECSTEEIWLDKFDDMIRWDGRFYGDMEIFIAKVADKA